MGEHVDESIQEVQAGSIDRTSAMLLAYQYAAMSLGVRTLRAEEDRSTCARTAI